MNLDAYQPIRVAHVFQTWGADYNRQSAEQDASRRTPAPVGCGCFCSGGKGCLETLIIDSPISG